MIVQKISVGQLDRGNQTLQRWLNGVKAAEREDTPDRRSLLETYVDISVDLQLSSVKDKRIRALKNVPFEWSNLGDGRHKENLQSPWFYDFLTTIGESIFNGYSVVEFQIDKAGMIGSCEIIPPQNVVPQKKIITREMWGSEEGVNVAENFDSL